MGKHSLFSLCFSVTDMINDYWDSVGHGIPGLVFYNYLLFNLFFVFF